MKRFKLVYFVLPIVSIICFAIIFWVYRFNFIGNFAKDQNHWGAFGSYFGGVAGPIIGLFSLFAVIFTIKLQALLLERQMTEFSKLHQLQTDTLNQTQEQVQLQKKQVKIDALIRQQENCLIVIQTLIKQRESALDIKIEIFDIESKINDLDLLKSNIPDVERERIELKKLKLQKKLLDNKVIFSSIIQELQLLTAEVLSPKFKTSKDLEVYFSSQIIKIERKFKVTGEVVSETSE